MCTYLQTCPHWLSKNDKMPLIVGARKLIESKVGSLLQRMSYETYYLSVELAQIWSFRLSEAQNLNLQPSFLYHEDALGFSRIKP